MNLSFLKHVRKVVSLAFFLVVLYAFIDFSGSLGTGLISGTLYLQFIPSLIKFIYTLSFTSIGFFFVFLVTLLFGRVYCSSVCPLGTLQDLITFLSRKTGIQKRHKYKRPANILRFVILGATIVSVAFISLFLVSMIDPYSVFGKIASSIFKPVYVGANNLLAAIFNGFDSYVFYQVEYKGFSLPVFVFAVIFLIALLFLAAKHGRLYCNTVCPVGTLLGTVSKASLFKIQISESKCTSCGLCAKDCKSGCIDFVNKQIDFSRCVACFNCLSSCPSNGIQYKLAWKKNEKQVEIGDEERRSVITQSLMAVGGTIGLGLLSESAKAYGLKPPDRAITPPGSKEKERFHNTCTACQLCISQCPTQVLQPSYLEFGFINMGQPKMDFHKSYCNINCTVCGEVCPNGAILPLTKEEKKLEQIGIAKFVRGRCVVLTEHTDCGACSEHCPTKAVHMVPYKDVFIPEVDESICIGCGACEYACPTTPRKAIYVVANSLHKQAEKPVNRSQKKEFDPEEDFPF
ncbi:MAG: hypothetical protein C0594_12155 [Marinilabiliales bacterium]|nr:MAG: hypothetical protein C0594_12155 [Marinilabiliales bacterium]